MIRGPRPRLLAPVLLTGAILVTFSLPTPPFVTGVHVVQAANPTKTPPGKGNPKATPRPTATPTPRPTAKPTPQPTPAPTPRSTPRRTATPAAVATPRQTTETKQSSTKPPGATPSESAAVVPTGSAVAGPGGVPAPISNPPGDGTAGPIDQGGGAPIGLIGLALVCGGGVFLALYRRRGGRPDEPVSRDPGSPTHIEVLADPLLEAMASSARAGGRRVGSGKRTDHGGPPVNSWVRRLDAEINGLVDLRALASPPPHERDEDVVSDEPRSA
jgi:hypothetical protein